MAAPLADRIRPSVLDEVVGQRHILGEGKALRRIMESGHIPNLIFYGPSGVGKTTVARIIAERANMRLHKLNGTTASTADIKAVVEELDTFAGMNGILLYLDEIQYFNKRQQQTLLEYIENGRITLIASTTENPYFYVYNAILSRSTVFEFKSVEPEEIEKAVRRGFDVLSGEHDDTLTVEESVYGHIARACGGDVRKALNAVELCVLAGEHTEDGIVVTEDTARQLAQRSAMRYDREGDEHYDIISAYQKSMRGSDANAALHYLARLLEAGDLPSACRRLMVCACEDVGLAYPQIIPIVNACVDMALKLGMPEARIPLGDAAILMATSPKSNTGHVALDMALADVREGKGGDFPRHLQNMHADTYTMEREQGYKYPHDYPGRWVKQQYLPDELVGTTYYQFGENKLEQAAKQYWELIKQKG